MPITIIKFNIIQKPMQSKTLINFSCSEEKKALYSAACKDLGISVSEICRRALDETVVLSLKMKERSKTMDKIITDNKRAFDKLAYEKSLGGEP